MSRLFLKSSLVVLVSALLMWSQTVVAQNAGVEATAEKEPQEPASKAVIFTTQQDHQNMLQQLGITKLRPGRNGNDKNAPNAANYDEANANPYPNLPDVMKPASGEKVSLPEQWWKIRRPEIVEQLESEVYGRIPGNVPDVKWEVRETRQIEAGGKPAIQKHIVGVVDNAACPEIKVNISMSLTLPKDAAGPVPVLMSFGWTPFEPSPFNFGGRGGRGGPGGPRAPSKEDKLIAAGWGNAILNPSTVQDDSGGWQRNPFGGNANADAKPTGAGLTRGIIGLTNLGQPRKPDDWGALRAWGWGASRALDYLETEPAVNAKRVGIAGVSRYGKAALVAMAFDQRFALGLIASSGAGGTKLYRRNFGESLENLASSGAYHWMAGNYIKYSAEESTFGRRTADDLPVDSHMTLALCAPRLTFISHGIPEKGDANWLDHQGSFMAAIGAQPVFRLLGARDLGRSDDYKTEKMPAVNVDMLDGELAWRQHDGGHTDEPNVEHFVKWADKRFAKTDGKEAPDDVAAKVPASDSGKGSAKNVVARPVTPGGAEVPDAVRIMRPTAAEVAQLEKALAAFKESADPQTKAILKDFPSLVEVHAPRPNTAIVPGLAPFFRQKHEANIAVAKGGKAELLLMGDSITDFWRNENGPFAGKQVLDKHFGHWNIANFGIAGDTTQGVLYRLQNGEGEGFSPRAVMLMIGTNNIGRNTAEEIAEGIGAVVLQLRKSFPEARILLLAVFPRGKSNEPVRQTIREINNTISKLDDGKQVHYLDIGAKFLNEEGNIPAEVMSDALHPSSKGYEIWAEAVAPALGKFMER